MCRQKTGTLLSACSQVWCFPDKQGWEAFPMRKWTAWGVPKADGCSAKAPHHNVPWLGGVGWGLWVLPPMWEGGVPFWGQINYSLGARPLTAGSCAHSQFSWDVFSFSVFHQDFCTSPSPLLALMLLLHSSCQKCKTPWEFLRSKPSPVQDSINQLHKEIREIRIQFHKLNPQMRSETGN